MFSLMNLENIKINNIDIFIWGVGVLTVVDFYYYLRDWENQNLINESHGKHAIYEGI